MYKGLMRRCKLIILWAVVFIILTGSAMIAFPGGSLIDKLSIHYNFFENYFSSLGATMTISGKENKISNIFFTIAMSGFGLVIIYFSKIWRAFDIDANKSVILGYLSKAFLIISGICFIGISFSPWNLYFENHFVFLKLAFISFLLWILLILIFQSGIKKLKKLFAINIVYSIFLAAYIYILFYGPNFGTIEELKFQVLSQITIFYITVVNLIIQATGVIRYLKTTDFRNRGLKDFYV